MTEQCKHKWRYDRVDSISYFACRHCHKTTSTIQAETMLNEHAILKIKNERLNKILGRIEKIAQHIRRKLDAFS